MKSHFLPIIIFSAILLLTCCTENNDPTKNNNTQDTIPKDTTKVVPNDTLHVALADSFLVAQLTISTENAAAITSRETYVKCTVTVKSGKSDWNYTGSAGIRGRGNSTLLWYPKKPYRIKLDDKAEILGLKAEKDWVLLANYRDPTQLMNTFVFTVGSGLGLPYTNHARYVEVTVNGDNVGLYLLTEQVEQGSNRVAIDSNEGILLSLDADDGPELNPAGGDSFWSTGYQMPVCVKSPNIISAAQLSAIKSDFAQLESAIKTANYDAVSKLLDIHSFIDYMIIQELVYNVEVDAPRSIYTHKNKAGLWVMGPLWDFDAGFDFDWSTMYAGHNYFSSYKELVLGTDPVNHTKGYAVPSFFTDMFRSKRFVTEYKARWLAIKDKIMNNYWKTTQYYVDGTASAMARNAVRWPIDKNYKTEIPRMQQWLTSRVTYLSGIIANYPEGTR
jgi:spore coat protein CotH